MELVRGRDGQLHPVLPPQFPFYVASRPEAGRCLMSTREVRPGEVVLTDSAIILGPASPLVCIVCCSSRGQRSRCPGCRHVLCSSCASHSEEECAILAKVGNWLVAKYLIYIWIKPPKQPSSQPRLTSDRPHSRHVQYNPPRQIWSSSAEGPGNVRVAAAEHGPQPGEEQQWRDVPVHGQEGSVSFSFK